MGNLLYIIAVILIIIWALGFFGILGTGLAGSDIQSVILVAKTLPTRVGNGPFPTEMWERQQAMDFAKDHAELFTDKAVAAGFLAEKLPTSRLLGRSGLSRGVASSIEVYQLTGISTCNKQPQG